PRLVADPAAGGRLELDGYGAQAPAGGPALPARVLLVAVPPAGDVRLRASAGGDEVFDDVSLAAAEPEVWARAGRPADDGAAARLLDVSWMRNQRVARVRVAPARFDP